MKIVFLDAEIQVRNTDGSLEKSLSLRWGRELSEKEAGDLLKILKEILPGAEITGEN